MVVSHAPAAVLPETEPGTYRLGVLVGHKGGLGVYENKKNLSILPGIKPPYLNHSVATA
jgi:hypothetical protein